ncbi:putative zinc finger protein [Terracoccus luteus]|uniref:Putative zinc finger protein n=1 Tax=Terracoccus luteus TaxID=53356 RepID=A0A495Y3A3_9MICO|nr:zf-HC2 domain-containing protein [Terracoccus luteus]RKT79934.1 putative zinc finger protein [Terracoccus luteus]
MMVTDDRTTPSGGHGQPLAELVEGLLPAPRRREVEAHVATCEACTAEVRLARLGREVGRRGRFDRPADGAGYGADAGPDAVEASDAGLHDRLMARLPAAARAQATDGGGSAAGSQRGLSRRGLLVAAAGLVVAAAGVEAVRRTTGGGETPVTSRPGTGASSGVGGADGGVGDGAGVLETAVADYRSGRLPVTGRPAAMAPDLRGLGLSVEASGGGRLAEQPVSAFRYRTGSGERVVVYVSDRPFTAPALQDAQYVPKPVEDMWVTWIPGRAPTLVLGEDERLVHDVCEALI